ncbi:hypothetical protein DRJ24_00330 [Candidatus Acetothermia bacterium]|nr:MAG: hypothetical protein DRJ24_00330 [Candidatus Acetothermia bacterium]
MPHRSFTELVGLIEKLRGEDGCPWDGAQTHATLRPYVLEEAYETIAAIDTGDPAAIADELGDLLLQVLLHAQIASEAGEFTIDDVIENLSAKLIRRHPHVFGDAPSDIPSIKRAWREIKAGEGRSHPPIPALLSARKLVETGVDPAVAAYPSGEHRAGGRILQAIKEAWGEGFDPEIALRKAVAHLNGEG